MVGIAECQSTATASAFHLPEGDFDIQGQEEGQITRENAFSEAGHIFSVIMLFVEE